MIDRKRGTNLMALVSNCRACQSRGHGGVMSNRQWATRFEIPVTSRKENSHQKSNRRFWADLASLSRIRPVAQLAPREFPGATQTNSRIGTTHENREQNDF